MPVSRRVEKFHLLALNAINQVANRLADMERQTLQQQVPVYHVCQECGGDGCEACADLCIVEGDLSPINTVIGIKARYVLCQDCLRVLPYTDARHQEEEFCTCGGQLCGCSGCNETVSLLLAGVRSPSDLRGVTVPVYHWSAERGLIPSPSFSVGDDDLESSCIYCGELGFHADDCLYVQSEPHPYPSDRELDFDADAGFAQ